MNIRRHRSAAVMLALTSAAAMPGQASAQSTIYGLITTSLNTSTVNGVRTNYMDDNGSRLGFRGVEDMGGGLTGLFGLELGYDSSNGTPLVPVMRTSYVGIGSPWGTVAMGRLDSANPTGSPIYSQMTAIVNFAPSDSGATQIGSPMFNGRNRMSNAIGYVTPDGGPWKFRARYYLRGLTTAVDDENVATQGRSLDLGLNYDGGALRAGVSYGNDTRQGGLAPNEMKSKWQTGVRYAVGGGFEPYLLYGRESYVGTATSRDTVTYWDIGAKYSNGPHAVIVNIMSRDLQLSRVAQRKKNQAAYLYALSKRTELQVFVDRDAVDNSKPTLTKTTYAAGVKHTF